MRGREDIGVLTMVLVRPDGPPDRRVVGGDHPTLAGGSKDLVLTEGPGCDVAKAADRPSVVDGAVCLGAVLDHSKTVRTRHTQERIHVNRPASQVHGDHGTGPRPDRRTHRPSGEVAGISVDIDEDGPSADGDHAGCRRHERPAWHQHLVARADANRA